jgi:hypothetical protein
MVVQTQDRHSGYFGAVGLHIGTANAKQYFPRDLESVELELDHLRIVCSLEASFWQDRPEIHDHRLSSWLEAKRNSGKLGTQASPVAMIPCGEYSFRIQVLGKEEADHLTSTPPSPSYFSPTVSPVALLDRRKHSVGQEAGQKPERRKVGRLRSDDRASASAND